MAFDGGFLYKVLKELRSACDSHIDKIYQPSKDELVFVLRKKGFVKRLYISVRPGSSRVQFTEEKTENPAVPPNFCMILRKYLSSARLLDITQPELERIAEFRFSSVNEMGDTEVYRLVCEFIGNQSNVILVRENGKIADALKRSDVETAKRYLLPSADYEYPPSMNKINPLSAACEEVLYGICGASENLSGRLLKRIEGFSPLVCREIEHRAKKAGLEKAYLEIVADLKGAGKCTVVYGPDGNPLDFSFIRIEQYGSGYSIKEFGSPSEALDAFYRQKENNARINAAAYDIIRLVKNIYSRTEKKLGLRLSELKKCENRETLRIYGELIKANLYKIKPGDKFAEVENYYDENLALVKIPLNPALSPAKNAEKYFKEYKKTYTAVQTLTVLTERDREELKYLESVLDSISRCKTAAEIGEIREELAAAGYIKRPASGKKSSRTGIGYKEYTSAEGYKILVGKNNIQNDYLTTKLASKNDFWFHVKDIPGSHVIVFCSGGELSDETVMQAAILAAQNSKARTSAQVPVDYTRVKYVKKPSSAKPGMVIYTTNKTVYVTPEKEVDL